MNVSKWAFIHRDVKLFWFPFKGFTTFCIIYLVSFIEVFESNRRILYTMSDYDKVRVGKLVLKGESSKWVLHLNRSSNVCGLNSHSSLFICFAEQKNVSINIRIKRTKVKRSDWLSMKMHKSMADGGVQQNLKISSDRLQFNSENRPILSVWITGYLL